MSHTNRLFTESDRPWHGHFFLYHPLLTDTCAGGTALIPMCSNGLSAGTRPVQRVFLMVLHTTVNTYVASKRNR